MHHLKRNTELNVGVPPIDGRHRELIRLANLIVNAVQEHGSRACVDIVVSKLREYTVFHFRCEEQLMDSVRYPGRADQEREHARLERDAAHTRIR